MAVSKEERQKFINTIAPLHIKFAKQYGYHIVSAAIAQACLESGYGTGVYDDDRNKVYNPITGEWRHNYYGLKYRPNRVTCSNGTFESKSREQNPDGTYTEKTFVWFKFASLEKGVEGYYQFLKISNYNNVRAATTPQAYLQAIKAAGYASSINYVSNVMNVVNENNLTVYDAQMNQSQSLSSVTYTNSSLATAHVDLNKNSNPRDRKYEDTQTVYNPTGAITVITPHHMAGAMTAKSCAEYHKRGNSSSANYYIGKDGDICLGVEEKYRAWTSGSRANDSKAITIEVSNDGGEPDWHVPDKALASLINLCVDICKRNGIKSLNYTGNANGNLTMHCMFQATTCPGPYLKSKFPYIAEEVNKRLGGITPSPAPTPTPTPQPSPTTYPSTPFYTEVLIDTLNIRKGPGETYPVTGTCKKGKYTIVEVQNNYGRLKSGAGWIYIANPSYTRNGVSLSTTPYTVKVTADVLNIRSGPGTNYPITGKITTHGVYTIVEEKNGWGKLKSGAGWICLDYTKKQ